MKRVISIIILLVLAFSFNVKAQDIHFTQFYASPLNLNPAFTGMINNCYRATVIYRNQWSSISTPTPYETFAASFDKPFFRGKLGGSFANDFIGGGLLLVRDKSGDAGLQEIGIELSGAYHKSLGNLGQHRLSLGFQVGYVNKRLDFSKLYFPDSWNKNTGEFVVESSAGTETGTGLNNSTSYIDFRTGLLWMGPINDKISAYGGIAMFGLTQPKESFFDVDAAGYRRSSRFVFHGGTRIKTGQRISIIPDFILMTQSKDKELNIGASVEYGIPDNTNSNMGISFGTWMRFTGKEKNFDAGKISESLIFSTGFIYKNFNLGISYDINISNLKVVSNNHGAFEVSLRYLGNCKSKVKFKKIQVPCRRF